MPGSWRRFGRERKIGVGKVGRGFDAAAGLPPLKQAPVQPVHHGNTAAQLAKPLATLVVAREAARPGVVAAAAPACAQAARLARLPSC